MMLRRNLREEDEGRRCVFHSFFKTFGNYFLNPSMCVCFSRRFMMLFFFSTFSLLLQKGTMDKPLFAHSLFMFICL